MDENAPFPYVETVPAFIITLVDDPKSMKAAQRCIDSIRATKSPITPFIYPAVDASRADAEAERRGLEYTYPKGVKMQAFGMELSPYETKDIRKRIGCFMSHYSLWEFMLQTNPLQYCLILEQDAIFTETFDKAYFDDVVDWCMVVSLNSPLKATRLAAKYDRLLKKAHKEENETILEDDEEMSLQIGDMQVDMSNPDEEDELKHFEVPWIDDPKIPQGLPGNSAYLITPGAAKELLTATDHTGIWPNDALMCKQLFENMLFCAYPYYTKVQGNPSTTTL